MDEYIPLVKKKYGQVIEAFPEFSDYTELVNNMSLPLVSTLKKKAKRYLSKTKKYTYEKV